MRDPFELQNLLPSWFGSFINTRRKKTVQIDESKNTIKEISPRRKKKHKQNNSKTKKHTENDKRKTNKRGRNGK
jgi:hypothetical protein